MIDVWQKVINETKCTIVWYMDDNKLLYMEIEVNNEISKDIKKHYGV